MPDPVPNTTDTTAPVATVTTDSPVTPPATTPARAPFTAEQQEEVNRIAANAREEGKRSVQRAATPAPTPAPVPRSAEPPRSADAPMTAADVQRMIAREGAIATHIARAGLGELQAMSVRSLLNAANPADVATWWKETIEPLGLGKQPAPPAVQPAAQAAPAQAPEAPRATPAVAPTAPSGPVDPHTSGGLVDLWSLTPQQLQTLGPQGVRKHLEAAVNLGNSLNGAPVRRVPGK